LLYYENETKQKNPIQVKFFKKTWFFSTNQLKAQYNKKRRTREHIIADLSTNHIEYLALKAGFCIENIEWIIVIDI